MIDLLASREIQRSGYRASGGAHGRAPCGPPHRVTPRARGQPRTAEGRGEGAAAPSGRGGDGAAAVRDRPCRYPVGVLLACPPLTAAFMSPRFPHMSRPVRPTRTRACGGHRPRTARRPGARPAVSPGSPRTPAARPGDPATGHCATARPTARHPATAGHPAPRQPGPATRQPAAAPQPGRRPGTRPLRGTPHTPAARQPGHPATGRCTTARAAVRCSEPPQPDDLGRGTRPPCHCRRPDGASQPGAPTPRHSPPPRPRPFTARRPVGPSRPAARQPAAPKGGRAERRRGRQSVQPFSPVAASTTQAFASVAEATGTIIV